MIVIRVWSPCMTLEYNLNMHHGQKNPHLELSGTLLLLSLPTAVSLHIRMKDGRQSHDMVDDDDDEFCIYIPLHVTKAKT